MNKIESNSPPQIIIISAMTRNHVIGLGDGMPWDLPHEYQHFLDTTRDQTIIIGRRSFEIFGPTLTCANCYVVTRGNQTFANATAAPSLHAAIELARQDNRDVFISGGASIYRDAIEVADAMQLSYIDGDFAGDTYFPEFDTEDWQVKRREDREGYTFVEYKRRGCISR